MPNVGAGASLYSIVAYLVEVATMRRAPTEHKLARLWMPAGLKQNRLLAGCGRTLIHFVTEDERFGMSTAIQSNAGD